jgi:hypothetical protein
LTPAFDVVLAFVMFLKRVPIVLAHFELPDT